MNLYKNNFFPKMPPQQKDYCPTGYFWITNISIKDREIMSLLHLSDEYSYFTNYIQTLHNQYQDVQIGDAFDIFGRRQNTNIVAIYVKPYPRKWKANRIRKYMQCPFS